jgi:peptide/nickel transport system substrate-binding protein
MAMALVAAACGGGGGNGGGAGSTTTGGGGDGDAGKPVPGGDAVYALEAETDDGWCLPSAQLAIAGIQVARSIYDQLAAPDSEGNMVPFLAQSIEPNADATEWTITLREGIKFHDGTDLTAEVVANNLIAYTGQYDNRPNVLLFYFVFLNIESIEATDALTVVVKMKEPWAAFPSFLYSSGRLGIMAQAQLDSPDHCNDEMIGTGPFKFEGDWVINDHLTLVKNENYWRKDADGTPLPYLDSITYVPVLETSTLVNGVKTGQYTLAHTDSAEGIAQLRPMQEAGDISLVESDKFPELGYILLNASKEPFDNINARFAVAHAFNYEEINTLRNEDLLTRATGPFGPGVMGNLPDQELPGYDLDLAKDYVAKYTEETGKPLEFSLSSTPDAGSIESANLTKRYFEEAGMKVEIRTALQAAYIDLAIDGDFQAMGWRNHPGFDPDTQYVWWYGTGNPVNFSRFNDEEINRLLDEGRAETDPAARQQIYEELNARFAEQMWSMWTFYTLWSIPGAPNLHGVFGPNLPTADSPDAVGADPYDGLAVGHDVSGLWLSQE